MKQFCRYWLKSYRRSSFCRHNQEEGLWGHGSKTSKSFALLKRAGTGCMIGKNSLMLILLLIGLWSSLFLPVLQVQAQPEDPRRLFNFAESLLAEGDYFRAITEYKRFLFLYPYHPLAKEASYNIGLAYFRGQEWEEAILQFRQVMEDYPGEEIAGEALFMIGESYYRQGDYESAIQVYQAVTAQFPPETLGGRAQYRLGWSLLRLRQWSDASKLFGQVDPQSPYFPSAQALAQEAKQGFTLPRKSPPLAGFLSSMLPGAGQAYTGRYRDALVALLLNGAFIAGGIEAIRAGNEALAGAIFFFEAGWYMGNIYGAVNAAHKQNRDTEDQFLRGLELEHGQTLRTIGKKTLPFVLQFSWEF